MKQMGDYAAHRFAPYVLARNRLIAAVVVMCMFGVVGAGWYVLSHAANAPIAMEAEQGAMQGMSARQDAAASAGSAAVFGGGTATAWHKPVMNTAWQIQLTGTVDETALDASANPNKLYDIDMFGATPALISRLHAKGIYVVCYIEGGDWSAGRPDAGDFAPAILSSNTIAGFPDEKYINVSQLDGAAGPTGKTLRQIMTTRLQMAKDKGCDGVDPDLGDLHTYPTQPFTITQAQQVAYGAFLIQTGHGMGMGVGQKNGADPDGTFDADIYAAGADWVINEECNQYSECGGYGVFIAGGRPVFQIEYLDNQGRVYSGANGTCSLNNAAGFDGIVKDSSSSLSASPRIACRAGN